MNYCRECGVITESTDVDLCLACSLDLEAEAREGLDPPDEEYLEYDNDIDPEEIDIEDLLD